ncbi:ferredoxin [Nocardia neocaledoniensis NBRC 108232]|uniref:Ferredoxin n=1 Tax=Nocardia neocaledoniensis TaxID=236511 RepID=A0A317NEU0_9NOCA|nr:ferredoxin [Nocardia neocaledoniensis]PWV72218.1 ferredoxin [Nocardia neocaledoniensis]GEM32489.1 ferredoxin [Nocardia neocaledoniensis NBRC 108232]
MSGLRIAADRDRCIAAGMCALLAGAVFDQDDTDGRVLLLDPTPGTNHTAVREAVETCPSGALTVDES